MRLATVLAGIAVISAGSASTLRADFKDFGNRCSSGAIRTCASIQMYTTLDANGGTFVRILVRNLQGWYGYDNSTGSSLTRIGIVTPQISGVSGGLTAQAISPAGQVDNPAGVWQLRTPGVLGGPIELTAGGPAGKMAGVVGCNEPMGGYPDAYIQTCGGGWAEFTFSTTNAWSANDAEIAWLMTRIGPNNTTVECGTDQGSLNSTREYCGVTTMVTPEPVTMLLLGSGLAGMGGFGLVRRRKKDGDVTNG